MATTHAISGQTLRKLIKRHHQLLDLEVAGVDNWSGSESIEDCYGGEYIPVEDRIEDDLVEIARPNTIMVWARQDAPEEYLFVRDDVDWVCFVPSSLEHSYIRWLDHLGPCETLEFPVDGGTVYIGTHA